MSRKTNNNRSSRNNNRKRSKQFRAYLVQVDDI